MKKINEDNMDFLNIVMIMTEDNPDAREILNLMMCNRRRFLDIFLCDSLDIRGEKLYKLFNDSCERNIDKFDRTLMVLRCGVFTQEEIDANLDLVYSIPFINDSISGEDIPDYNIKFGPTDEGWDEFCEMQRVDFLTRLAYVKSEDKEYKKTK